MPLPEILDERNLHQHIRAPQSHPRLPQQQHHYGISISARERQDGMRENYSSPHRVLDIHRSVRDQPIQRSGQPSNILAVPRIQHSDRNQGASGPFRLPTSHNHPQQILPQYHSHRPPSQLQHPQQGRVHPISPLHTNQRPPIVGSPSAPYYQSQGPEQYHHHHHHHHPQQQQQRPIHTQSKPPETRRIVANFERQHLDRLMSALSSWDKLTMESLHRNESLPRTRQLLRNEVSDFLRTIPPNNTSTAQIDFTQPLHTNSDTDLTRPPPTRPTKPPDNLTSKSETAASSMTFTEFTRRAKEAAARNTKIKSQPRSPQSPFPATTTPTAKPSRVPSSSRVILSPTSRIANEADNDDDTSPQQQQRDKGKGKGKGKVRRRIWEDAEGEGEGDILDDLNI